MSKSPMQPTAITMFPLLVKLIGSTEIGHIANLPQENWSKIGAFGVDGDGIIVYVQGTIYTWNEAIAIEGMTPEAMVQMNIIEITEEEFLTKTFE